VGITPKEIKMNTKREKNGSPQYFPPLQEIGIEPIHPEILDIYNNPNNENLSIHDLNAIAID